jgi:hypothetical protein
MTTLTTYASSAFCVDAGRRLHVRKEPAYTLPFSRGSEKPEPRSPPTDERLGNPSLLVSDNRG